MTFLYVQVSMHRNKFLLIKTTGALIFIKKPYTYFGQFLHPLPFKHVRVFKYTQFLQVNT